MAVDRAIPDARVVCRISDRIRGHYYRIDRKDSLTALYHDGTSARSLVSN